jgi:RNA polymerase sigma-70 factor (ECF subfamily)
MVLDGRTGRPTDEDGADARLAAELAGGSRVAMGRLYHRHKDAVYRLAYRITGRGKDAEDVLQDVFVGLERALAR